MNLSLSLNELITRSKHDTVFLFLDYDGTLAEFAPNPDIVLPDKKLINLLLDLRNHPQVELAIVSGRRLGHIRNLVPLGGLWLAGSYGVELIDPQGNEINLLEYEKLRPKLENVKPDWESLVQDRNEFYLEDKGWSIAIHANGKDQNEVAFVIEQANKVKVPKGFILQGNDHFIELCPPEADKGKAIRYLMNANQKKDQVPIFLGDEERDESAFEAVKALGGTAILVAERPYASKADYYIPNPKMVRHWLKSFVNS